MTSNCRTFGALLARLRQNRFDSAGWRPGAIRNVVKWYGGVVQVAPASEVSTSCQLFSVRSCASSCGRVHLPDVAASHSLTAVAAAETLRRHIRRLLLRQQ